MFLIYIEINNKNINNMKIIYSQFKKKSTINKFIINQLMALIKNLNLKILNFSNNKTIKLKKKYILGYFNTLIKKK